MNCPKCNAPTTVRNTYAETTYDARAHREIPVVVRYRSCARCGSTRKTVEMTADTLLRLKESHEESNAAR